MLVWACIAPHGGELISELAGENLRRMRTTRRAMEQLGEQCLAAAPETIVVFTPHGLSMDPYATISISTMGHGALGGENGSEVAVTCDIDIPLAKMMAEEAASVGVPVALALFDDDGEPAPVFPLDWGALIPLWFMGVRWPNSPQIVVVCPSRQLSRSRLVEFGEATVRAAAHSNRRIAIICSADQGHGHDAEGPYGFSPGSAPYDRAYCRAVRENALGRLLYWREDRIAAALTDSFWQTLMLHGALKRLDCTADLLSYESPTYFGMACAAFANSNHQPKQGTTIR